jgi:hypothetical protein
MTLVSEANKISSAYQRRNLQTLLFLLYASVSTYVDTTTTTTTLLLSLVGSLYLSSM